MYRKQMGLVWPSLVLLVLMVITVGFVFTRERSTDARANAIAPGAAADQSDTHGLVIAIRPTGFTPAEIEITDGNYLFIVQNRSGIRDLTFRLDRDTGARLHEVRDQKLQWKKQFDLQPGTYVLSIVDHPAWQCVIRVKPR